MRKLLTLIAALVAGTALAGPVDDARQMYLDGEFEAALKTLIPAAEAGDANAQNIVADAYDEGNGVTQDHDKALELWIKSANQGFSRARYNLGLLYENGRDGIAPDIEEAIRWYLKAAASKNPDAFTNLGYIFESGKRGAPDFDLAQQYYRGGVALGASQSMSNLGKLYIDGTGVTQDYSDALALFQEAALLGNGNAISNLGAMYENGYGVVRDVTAAYALYFEALYLNHPRAALKRRRDRSRTQRAHAQTGTEIFRAERVGSRVRHKYIVIHEVVRGIDLGLSQIRVQRIGIRRERITNRLLYCTK